MKVRFLFAGILLTGVLIASGILASAHMGGALQANAFSHSASASPRWSEPAGNGISVPACSSASPTITCSNNQPVVTFYWSDPNTGPGDVLYINYPYPIWTGFPTNGVLTVPPGILANNTSYTYRNQDFGTVYNDNTPFTTPNCNIITNTGTVNVNATLNGSPWSGSLTYNYSGPISGTNTDILPASHPGLPTGTYTLSYNQGGPAGASLQSITANPSPTLSAGGTITFTFNFTTPIPSGTVNVNATLDGSPWPGSLTYNYSGPISGTNTDILPASHPGLPTGTYTLSYNQGGPAGASLYNIIPSATQTLSANGTITFTFRFVSSPPTNGTVNVNATLNGSPWSSSVDSLTYNYSGPISGTNTDILPASHPGLPTGTYTLFYNSGGPAGASLYNIIPSATQTLSANGTITFTFNFVMSPPFDYSLSNSGDISVTQGSSGSNSITATLTSGITQGVSFSASSPPSGATASFSPTSCSPTCGSTLTISTTASTPTGTYPITVTGFPFGHTTSFNLIVSSQPVPSANLTANPTSITQGQSSTLSWTSSNVTWCSISGLGGVGVSGSYGVSPSSTTTYTLTCGGAYGNVTSSATVTVTALPPFDYSLSNSGNITVTQGSSGSNTITITLQSGTPEDVQLVFANGNGLPAVNSASFSPRFCTPTCSSTLTIETSPITPPGSYPITVTGTTIDGKINHTTSFTLTVNQSFIPAALLVANPSSINAGGVSMLSWGSSNVSSCSIDNGIGSVPLSGTTSVSPSSTTTYTLTCYGVNGRAHSSATVTVNLPSLRASCSVSPGAVYINNPVTWSALASGGDGTYSYSWSGTDGLSGSTATVSKSYATVGTKTGNITVTSAGQTVTSACSNSVAVSYLPVCIGNACGGGGVDFHATPPSINPGGSSTLSWTSQNATACSIDQGIGSVPLSGSAIAWPIATTTYTLTCTGPGGSASAKAIVTVSGVPTFKEIVPQ